MEGLRLGHGTILCAFGHKKQKKSVIFTRETLRKFESFCVALKAE
jgi:hypothetical protein